MLREKWCTCGGGWRMKGGKEEEREVCGNGIVCVQVKLKSAWYVCGGGKGAWCARIKLKLRRQSAQRIRSHHWRLIDDKWTVGRLDVRIIWWTTPVRETSSLYAVIGRYIYFNILLPTSSYYGLLYSSPIGLIKMTPFLIVIAICMTRQSPDCSTQFLPDTPDKPSPEDRIAQIHLYHNIVRHLIECRHRDRGYRRFGRRRQSRQEKKEWWPQTASQWYCFLRSVYA